MCGIAGICQVDASPLTPEAGQWVKAMTDRMSHRGPDGEGQWSSGPVCLGHRRLSIIDLSGGGQPMHSADGQMTVTFNGEIYNYAELKEQLTALGGQFQTSSDTEVILEGYRIWGPDCLARFVGMFAFIGWVIGMNLIRLGKLDGNRLLRFILMLNVVLIGVMQGIVRSMAFLRIFTLSRVGSRPLVEVEMM